MACAFLSPHSILLSPGTGWPTKISLTQSRNLTYQPSVPRPEHLESRHFSSNPVNVVFRFGDERSTDFSGGLPNVCLPLDAAP